MSDEAPAILGNAGLSGRQPIVRVPEFDKDEEGNDLPLQQPIGAMPGNCRRVLSSPLSVEQGGGCRHDCPGFQRNGGCLLDVIKAAEQHGIKDWKFDVDPHDLRWDYTGPPIPGYNQVRGDRPGEVIGVFDVEPAGPYPPIAVREPPSFECPFCHTINVQDLDNFHFWCSSCGRNASDPEAA